MRRAVIRLSAGALLAAAATAIAQEGGGADGPCDRACLLDLLDDYLGALVAHDPGRLRLADDAKFVENIEAKPFGQGLWRTASRGPTTFAIPVPDPVAGQVGFLGVLEERGEPILLALRLELDGREIDEAEHLIARNLGEINLENLQVPRPGLLGVVPPGERMPRAELIRIGRSYYDAIVEDDGSLTPFADDCVRRENGMQTTGNPPSQPGGNPFRALDCAFQLTSGAMGYIDSIEHRRVEIADPQTGLVFGLSHFRHAMERNRFPVSGIPGIEVREINLPAFDLPAAHVFKITGGEMHEIEAVGFLAPYDSPTGWE